MFICLLLDICRMDISQQTLLKKYAHVPLDFNEIFVKCKKKGTKVLCLGMIGVMAINKSYHELTPDRTPI